MRNPNLYHCLVAGLPEIDFDEEKEWISIPEFREMLRHDLEPEDFEQVKLIFLRDDNKNLLDFMDHGEINEDTPGCFRIEDFSAQMQIFDAIVPEPDILPPYMTRVLKKYTLEDGDDFDRVMYSHMLADSYFDHIMELGTEFLKEFTRFQYDVTNLMAFLEADSHNMDRGRFITGRTSHSEHLRNSVTGILAKDPEFEYFDEILSIAESPTIVEQEMKVDRLMWNKLEQMTFFEDFNINFILGYLERMIILSRWSTLTQAEGEDRLRRVIRGSEEFAAKNIQSEN